MATKVFVSWSGETSQKLGGAFVEWLPSVIQSVKPYFTPDDIEKGAKWGSEISKNLAEANIGIICLTRQNLERPWILFEAGALSKNFEKSKVCTILFGLAPADAKPPLSDFQHTLFSKIDFSKLLKTINRCSGENALPDHILDNVFDKWWPDLERQVDQILKDEKSGSTEVRSERDLLHEILDINRSLLSKVNSERPASHIPSGWFMKYCEAIKDFTTTGAPSRSQSEIINFFIQQVELMDYIAKRSGSPTGREELVEARKALTLLLQEEIRF